jgi:hypothetical protein
MALILTDHLFDIPGLIARHHQGSLGKLLGPWFTWMMAIASAAVCVFYAVITTRNWLQLRTAAMSKGRHVS